MFSMKHELKCELLSKNLRSLLLATGPTALKHEHVCLQWAGGPGCIFWSTEARTGLQRRRKDIQQK